MRFHRLAALSTVLSVALAAWLAACGSRTGLPEGEGLATVVPGENGDAGGDAARTVRDAGLDALPLIDARPQRDADRSNCPDAAATLVYLISTENDLVSFDPPSATFQRIGKISCPAPARSSPFSMAVDRRGTAYVLFNGGELFRVSTRAAACEATAYRANQGGLTTFGMGYAADDDGPGERLYTAADQTPSVRGLGFIDDRFALIPIAPFDPAVAQAELTGTADGRLFAFYRINTDDSAIGLIDKGTARVLAQTPLLGVSQGNSWAFAYWGGDFYTFTAPSARSVVTRFRPSDGSIRQIAVFQGDGRIVGAGVSTCAPQ